MRRFAWAAVALLMACGGDGGSGPGAANVQGVWIITFTSSGTCTLSQIALTLLADGTSPYEGSHGSYAVSCVGQNQIPETAGNIAAYQVSGSNVSVQFSNAAQNQKFLTGSVNGATMSGNFSWNSDLPGASYTITGTYSAAKQ